MSQILLIQINGKGYLLGGEFMEPLQNAAESFHSDGKCYKGTLKAFVRDDGNTNVRVVKPVQLTRILRTKGAHLVVESPIPVENGRVAFSMLVFDISKLASDAMASDLANNGRLFYVKQLGSEDTDQILLPVTP